MKAAPVRYASCQKEFVLKSIKNGIRLDGRQSYDYRNINIEFGVDYGCCEVQLGDTKVLAQTSCELVKPVGSRSTEGQLFINVDLSPMASPAFEIGRMSSQAIEINHLIDRCLKESRPIDVESLCLVAGEKVWCIRVDVLILNDSGNLLDCASIAAITALAHFRRPDVTVTGSEVVIHSFKEKAAVPLNVHHMPLTTTFGFIPDGEQVLIDPDDKEESIVSGKLVMAFNVYGEVCCAQMNGGVSLDYEQIMQCAKIAAVKATEITELIKSGLEGDRISREPAKIKRRPGLKDPVITKTVAEPSNVDLSEVEEVKPMEVEESTEEEVEILGDRTASVGGGGVSKWQMSDDSDQEEPTDALQDTGHKPSEQDRQHSPEDRLSNNEPTDDHNGDQPDSEEEDVMILHANQLDQAKEQIVSDKENEQIVSDKENEQSTEPRNNNKVKKKKKKKTKKSVVS